jgi:exopolysaccharide biosynthesis protein
LKTVALVKRALTILTFLLASNACADDWEPISSGVEYRRITRGNIDVHITKIDLRNDAIRVIATNEAEMGLTVSEYAQQKKAIVAINADYFDPQLRPIGLAAGPCGVWWDGDPKTTRRQGLVAVGDERASIQNREMKTERWMSDGAVSGWPALITSCEPIAELPGSDHFTRAPHPRTAVGLSRDRRLMYFVVADGRREGVPGMTLPELAELMDKELDACAALNLDGGGSSAMWVRDSIVNRPSDGKERKVSNHLAVVPASAVDDCGERDRRKKE